jgi:hypothetical protein
MRHVNNPGFLRGRPGENFPARITCAGLARSNFNSSYADLVRVLPSVFPPPQGGGAHGSSPWAEGPPVEPGQEKNWRATSLTWQPQDFPRTALRFLERMYVDAKIRQFNQLATARCRFAVYLTMGDRVFDSWLDKIQPRLRPARALSRIGAGSTMLETYYRLRVLRRWE